MNRAHRSLFLRALILAAGVAGCNSILDNTPGTAQQPSQATPSVDDNQPAQSGNDDSIYGDASTTLPVTQPTPVTATGCDSGKMECNGLCVALDDPTYGCGNPACTPCAVTHATAACSAGACAVKACDKGYSDCNGKAADGCEVDLSKATSCGSCNAVCPAATPVCAPSADSFQCGSGCTPDAPLLCGTECVAPATSPTHCGSCDMACPIPANGTATCAAGACGFTCQAGFNACRGACTAATDPTACGATCTVCPTPPNSAPTCAANTCSFTCSPNFGDCNGTPADGCEAPFQTDVHNCGKCGVDCGTGTCTNGACVAADAGAPPP